jgi:hypothetical protein
MRQGLLDDCSAVKFSLTVEHRIRRDSPDISGQSAVIADTDVYDKPDGKGQKSGTLFVGETHPLMEPCRDDWCRVGQIEFGVS